ncbi:MAG: hypothetical protein COB84_01525 [Rhodobacteraceae bacterium]|nr:MAG: hypothetical protein COB84_01525 [Paracoccaceae bacterium]
MNRRDLFLSSISALVASHIVSPAWAQSDPLKLGFLIPKSGPAGIFGPSSEACTTLAIEQINAEGGILGRKVEAFFGDAGGTPSDTVQAAQRLWRRDGVEALIGQHDSASREAVAAMLRGQLTYVYTPVNEGSYCHTNTYSLGETPQQQLAPVIPWLAEQRNVSKWYLIGNDYVWPRGTNAAAKNYITEAGGEVVGEEYHPFTVDNFDTSLTRIKEREDNYDWILPIITYELQFITNDRSLDISNLEMLKSEPVCVYRESPAEFKLKSLGFTKIRAKVKEQKCYLALKNKSEMIKHDSLNRKSLQEAVLYYMREKIKHKGTYGLMGPTIILKTRNLKDLQFKLDFKLAIF